MIVRAGKIIEVDVGDFHLQRSCATPGMVRLSRRGHGSIELPANQQEALEFIKAYWRTVTEDISYVERKNEWPVTLTDVKHDLGIT